MLRAGNCVQPARKTETGERIGRRAGQKRGAGTLILTGVLECGAYQQEQKSLRTRGGASASISAG